MEKNFISMQICNKEDCKVVDKKMGKLSMNTAFKQIIGKALEPYDFKIIKGRYPYIVRFINNEILHIITLYPENPDYPPDKAFVIVGGVATIYRKRISLDISPKQNHEWFNYISNFYTAFTNKKKIEKMSLYKACYYSDNIDTLISALEEGSENIIKYVLPIMDKVNDIDSCIDYMQNFMCPCNPRKCTKICSYYPDEDESFLYFLSDRAISKSFDFLTNFIEDTEFHNWVLDEIEKRKNGNLDLLKKYDIV